MHLNGINSYTFNNGVEIYTLKAKGSEINTAQFCLVHTLKDFSSDNVKKTMLYGYVYDFSIDYDNIDVADI